MSEIATLVRLYVDRYNSNDVDGMLDCCVDDVIFETIANPGGSIRLTGKIEMREIIEATTRAFRERRQEVVNILVDGDKEDAAGKHLLLQIFTQNCIGPIFFEIIQRKGNEGFGEGNFRALFLSIEADQMRRGVI